VFDYFIHSLYIQSVILTQRSRQPVRCRAWKSDHVLLASKRIYYWMECNDVAVCRVIYTIFPVSVYYKKKLESEYDLPKTVHFLCTSVEYTKKHHRSK